MADDAHVCEHCGTVLVTTPVYGAYSQQEEWNASSDNGASNIGQKLKTPLPPQHLKRQTTAAQEEYEEADVNPKSADFVFTSVGVETPAGLFQNLIPKGTGIPTERTYVASTTLDNQTALEIHVLQGESILARMNKTLAKVKVTGIVPAPKGVPRIQVTLTVNALNELEVCVIDQGSLSPYQLKAGGLLTAQHTDVPLTGLNPDIPSDRRKVISFLQGKGLHPSGRWATEILSNFLDDESDLVKTFAMENLGSIFRHIASVSSSNYEVVIGKRVCVIWWRQSWEALGNVDGLSLLLISLQDSNEVPDWLKGKTAVANTLLGNFELQTVSHCPGCIIIFRQS